MYHALAVVDCFFENVKVHDLEHRELAADEKEKNVVLQFTPTPARHMFVPCLWSPWTGANEPDLRSFSIITDDPPTEVAAAGHNRCPINLKESNIDAWLMPAGRTGAELDALLADRETPFYQHEVLAA
jgi:putative SOS response-associated peptidase YedK